MKEPNFKGIVDFLKRFPDEESCISYLIQARWDDKPVCPHCESDRKIYKIKGGRILTCADCRKQFTVKVGTIFEDSALPLQKWFMAIYILTAHKKGISSLQLSRDINVTQKTAWFMLHRIRYAVKVKSFDKPLMGTIEADETYVGGKKHGTRGRGSENKTPVFGMIQRKGDVRCMPVKEVDAKTLQGIIGDHVGLGSVVMTDEWRAYNGLCIDYTHKRIGHLKKQYVKGGTHTQNIEGFWSQMKRGINGIYHAVSPKHLERYCDEFSYKHNTRKVNDSQRFASALGRVDCRLTYKNLISEEDFSEQ
jgi:transposase-like protein